MFLAGSPFSLRKSNFEHFEQLLRKGGQGVSQKYLRLFAIFFVFCSIQLVLLIYVDMRLTTRMMRLVIPPCLVVCYHNTSYCDFPCLLPSQTAHTNTSHFFGELSTTLQINVRKITFFVVDTSCLFDVNVHLSVLNCRDLGVKKYILDIFDQSAIFHVAIMVVNPTGAGSQYS